MNQGKRQHFQRVFAQLLVRESKGAQFAAEFADAIAVDDVAAVAGGRGGGGSVDRILDLLRQMAHQQGVGVVVFVKVVQRFILVVVVAVVEVDGCIEEERRRGSP